MSIPFLDELVSHIDQRFSDIQQKVVMGLNIVPSVIKDNTVSPSTLSELTDFYHEYLPSPSTLDAELHLWERKWCDYGVGLPDTPAKALHFANKSMYPNNHCILQSQVASVKEA